MRPLLLALALAPTLASAQPDCFEGERCLSGLEIAAVNVGVTGVLALARGAATGNVRSWADAARTVGVGAASGLGFALAKREIGAGRTYTALPLVYASASVVENVAEGEHPLGRLRLGLGPADVRVRTPLAHEPSPLVAVEIDPLAAAALVALPLAGFRPELNGGVLFWRSPDRFLQVGNVTTSGVSLGRVILVGQGELAVTKRHEAVHALQSRQVGAVAPFGTAGALVPGLRRTSLGGRVSWDVRTGIPTGAFAGAEVALRSYDDRYLEREAFALERR